MTSNTLTAAIVGLCLGTTLVCAWMFASEMRQSHMDMAAQKVMQRSVRLLHSEARK